MTHATNFVLAGEQASATARSRVDEFGGRCAPELPHQRESVTVPAGETTATFDVKALGELGGGDTITANVLVFIEARLNGVSRAAGFVVEPKQGN